MTKPDEEQMPKPVTHIGRTGNGNLYIGDINDDWFLALPLRESRPVYGPELLERCQKSEADKKEAETREHSRYLQYLALKERHEKQTEELVAAEAECLEQARLLGIGGERELALMAKLEAVEKERDRLIGEKR